MKKIEQEEVSSFYDNFAHEVLVNDLKRINKRQKKAMDFCRSYLRPSDSVLEIGTGAGIITRFLCENVAMVTSIDISAENIRIAKLVCESFNVDFIVSDMLNEGLSSAMKGLSFDVIVLIDVIEHIPLDQHEKLFDRMTGLLRENGRIILTFPSTGYQDYLRSKKPEALQVIDENVHLGEMFTYPHLRPVYLRYVDVYMKQQYVHLVMEKAGESFFCQQKIQIRFGERVINKLKGLLWASRNRKILSTISKGK